MSDNRPLQAQKDNQQIGGSQSSEISTKPASRMWSKVPGSQIVDSESSKDGIGVSSITEVSENNQLYGLLEPSSLIPRKKVPEIATEASNYIDWVALLKKAKLIFSMPKPKPAPPLKLMKFKETDRSLFKVKDDPLTTRISLIGPSRLTPLDVLDVEMQYVKVSHSSIGTLRSEMLTNDRATYVAIYNDTQHFSDSQVTKIQNALEETLNKGWAAIEKKIHEAVSCKGMLEPTIGAGVYALGLDSMMCFAVLGNYKIILVKIGADSISWEEKINYPTNLRGRNFYVPVSLEMIGQKDEKACIIVASEEVWQGFINIGALVNFFVQNQNRDDIAQMLIAEAGTADGAVAAVFYTG